jgi:NAD+ synthase (glutamine-hydrolysing)
MAGGFIPLKDVPKTTVYRLAQYRNRQVGKAVIPSAVLTKAPSAELRPDQKDTDTLPPYDVLDPILKAYVEDDLAIDQIVAMGFDRDTVIGVARLVDRSEYKRRQAAPGIKITLRDFGRDRRLPITNRFREE